MDTRNVIILVDVDKYTKGDICKELKAEGYTHNFFFANFNDANMARKVLEQADEVWVFGDCKDLRYFKLAKEKGKDIWQMAR